MAERRFVVVAPTGMLGRAFVELGAARGLPLRTAGRQGADLEVDLLAPTTLAAIDDVDVVINCAAWTDVDGAETHEADATRLNGDAVRALAERCRDVGALLVHFGTDYVFDGEGEAPYPVDAPLAPLNAYGRSKAAGERALAEVGAPHLYLRTSWLYAPWGKNFVLTIAKLARERDALKVVDDQRGRPTSAEGLARTTLALVEAGARGTLHATDGGECTWFELAAHIASRVAPGCAVQPCSSDEYPRPAKRPRYSVLDLGPTEALIGPLPDWREQVDAVLAKLS
ncbi:MAG: dTDP-4-dehydrorhamnose reductase [Myxococcales bacterium]|nr:dTDP-4-dehydrorhamnose reductase [Myxococcales bacterium]